MSDGGRIQEDKSAFHFLEQARSGEEHSEETLVDTALKAIPPRRELKRVSLQVSDQNLSNSDASIRPPFERRKSVALSRILESLTTVEINSSNHFENESSEFSPSLRDNESGPRPRLHQSLAAGLRAVESEGDPFHPSVSMFLRRVIQEEFPQENHPVLRDLIHCGKFRDKASLYKPGDWVEIQGANMEWTLEMITRVVKQAPPDWDWNNPANEDKDPDWEYFYHAGYMRMLPPEELRSPKEGLLRLFGTRPFLWQQWVCIKLEQTLRFQKGHQNDFEWRDTQKFALDYWERWLHHPDNSEFYNQFYDERIGEFGRRQLVDHIMSPFKLIEKIKHDHERWNFDDDDSISVYSYLSIFGTVFVLPCVIVLLQFSIPALLFLHLDYSDSSGEKGDLCQGYDNLVWYGTVGEECEINRVAQSMAIAVLGYYLFKVVPDVFASFYNVVGSNETPYSKLQSVRSQIWKQREDRTGQIIGYQMDVYMNTAYVCVLYMLNILVIINTDNAFEIVLNALAFEFVIDLDHEFAKSTWWDEDKRWIKAGAIELILQRTIWKTTLSSPKRFSSVFHVPLAELNELCANADGRPSATLLKDKGVAAKDVEDEQFMTNDEKIKHQCKKIAIELQNKHAVDEYQKGDVDFGMIKRGLRFITGRKGGGVFDRHAAFRTWSRWEKLLYLPPVPSLDLVFDSDTAGSFRVKRDLKDVVSTSKAPFANFKKDNKTDWEQFRSHYINVITFIDSCRTLKSVWKERKACGMQRSAFVLIFDGPIKWLAFFVQGVFPFYNVVCLVAVIIAVARGKVS